MPEFHVLMTMIAAIVLMIILVLNDDQYKAYAAQAKARAERLKTIAVGQSKGAHTVVAEGKVDGGYYYLVRSSERGDAVFAVAVTDHEGRMRGGCTAQVAMTEALNMKLNIGTLRGKPVVYDRSTSKRAVEPDWLRFDLNRWQGRCASDVLWEIADACCAYWRPHIIEREESLKRETEARRAEDARRAKDAQELQKKLDEIKQREVWEEAEYWEPNGTGIEGAIERYMEAPPAHRTIIQKSMLKLLSQHERDIDRINFHALGDDARKLFLPAFLNIEVGGSTPIYDLDASYRGTHIYICRHGAANAAAWRPYLPQINRYLGGTWSVEELDATRIQLKQIFELPAVLPFHKNYLEKGQVFCGIGVLTGDEVYVPLAKMTHMLVCGQTGSGKSVGLNQLQRSLLHNIDDIAEIAACDLKGGVDLARFAGLSPKIHFVDNYADMHELAERWVGIMKARFADMRAKGETNTTSNYRILIVDEFSEIGGYEPTKEEKPRHAKLLANLTLLAQQGRAAGIRLILQTQAPTADYLPTSIMKNLPSVMCYRMNSRQNIAAVFAGYGDNLPADPASFKAGEYLFANGATGELTHVRTTACHEYDVEALKACLPTPIDW